MRGIRFVLRGGGLIGAFLVCAFAPAQTHLAVTSKGKPAGFATLSQHVQADGVKVVELRMEIASNGSKVKITSEARYDQAGMPVRKFQQVLVVGGSQNKQVIATFARDGAHVTSLDGEKRSIKTVALPPNASPTNLSEFWFVRDKPKPGQIEQSFQFNTDSLEWEQVRTEYRGKKTLKVEDRTVPVHEVVTSRGGKQSTAYVDDQGLPVLIDLGDVKMVKIWQK
jgi:hypothetical protein